MEYNEREPVVGRISPMDAATSKTLDNHSHVVRPAEMEWKKTRFPGCEVKGLLLEKQTGLVTALMRGRWYERTAGHPILIPQDKPENRSAHASGPFGGANGTKDFSQRWNKTRGEHRSRPLLPFDIW
jgi:hypothetical protein